jgi:hypothetical protein
MAAVQHQQDVGAVKGVLSSLYRKWLQEAAARMQQAVVQSPLENYQPEPPPTGEPGTCILFSDALRYDIGQRLAGDLERRGMRCDIAWRLSALPTVTAVGKPAVSPVAGQVEGRRNQGLTPVVTKTGTSVTAGSLRRLLQDAGWQTLSAGELGDPSGRAWTEMGDLDSYGHQHDWKIAHRMRDEVKAIGDRVESLLDHGWKRVEIVTDHGWLMLPGDLPKVELPIHVTEVRKGRCAVLKPGVKTDQPSVPWHWNPEVRVAVAPGIHCYEAGKEYEHGGISPQECVIPVITATAGE